MCLNLYHVTTVLTKVILDLVYQKSTTRSVQLTKLTRLTGAQNGAPGLSGSHCGTFVLFLKTSPDKCLCSKGLSRAHWNSIELSGPHSKLWVPLEIISFSVQK